MNGKSLIYRRGKMPKNKKFSESPYTKGAKQLGTQDELDAIAKYQGEGCQDAIESVLKSRSVWVQSILSNASVPSWCDMDTLFSDVMINVYSSLNGFDRDRSSVSTYLRRVVMNATASSLEGQNPKAEQIDHELLIDHAEDFSDCVDNVRSVVADAPEEMMNERARKVAHYMLKGYDATRIGRALSVNRSVAEELILSVRRYIAWMMVKKNLSASPIISDSDLVSLAAEHEDANRSVWG
jgi:DNA-directed RNA polymerase specialized sigma24 family protein